MAYQNLLRMQSILMVFNYMSKIAMYNKAAGPPVMLKGPQSSYTLS